MSMREIVTQNEEDTAALAASLAAHLSRGDVLLLSGDLGAGKSVFARALIRALAGRSDLEVPSPTFTLIQTYETPRGLISHFDLYRLKNPDEVFEIGWEDALADGITIVEWPERLGELTPENAKRVTISQAGECTRRISLSF